MSPEGRPHCGLHPVSSWDALNSLSRLLAGERGATGDIVVLHPSQRPGPHSKQGARICIPLVFSAPYLSPQTPHGPEAAPRSMRPSGLTFHDSFSERRHGMVARESDGIVSWSTGAGARRASGA